MHQHMILSVSECEKLTLLPKKTTAIMATCQSNMKCLMWTVFSLLLRSGQELEHIIVVINGPDKRTGDPELQDKKQRFLEELRSMRWITDRQDRDMPLTIIRAWSRVGHSQCLDSAIPWVHTEGYTLIHDDMIVEDRDWVGKVMNHLSDSKVGLVYHPPLLAGGLSWVSYNGTNKLNLPHPNSACLSCRKEVTAEISRRWSGHHIAKTFRLSEGDRSALLDFYKAETHHAPPPDMEFGYFSMDIGAWIYCEMKRLDYKFVGLEPNSMTHLCAMSWRSDPEGPLKHNKKTIDKLEEEIKAHPTLGPLYEKYALE